ncbi:MAG: hypothetical protein J7598_16930 [Mitsuaria chitosanitabida]|jgi:hypothetical protein|uniref:hypothetical protein n=1 Tax=Roseateles chitosanitabidus TaxID=65048 RepID=UPI001B1D9FEE|nr:hypothetical protein [Roseateles chitosanitabidus]MBO9688289.1 hypothetical protein [Roseateles chitosanitabidus]
MISTTPILPADLPKLIGLTELDAPLVAAILQYAPGVEGATELSQKRKKEMRAGFVMLKALGVVMSFSPREAHAADYGEPQGAGESVLSALFYYPEGSEEVDPFEGLLPFAEAEVATREDAHREFGEPADGEEEEGVVEWEQWLVDDFEVTADYDEDGTLLTLTVALPVVI